MMESVNHREESHNTFFPTLLAFVRFSIWSLFNAIFVLFVGQDSAFMDKFPTFHVELEQEDEKVTKPSMPIIETHYGGNEEYHQEILNQEMVMYTEVSSQIDAKLVPAPQAEKKKNNTRRKKVKTPKVEAKQGAQKEQSKPVEEDEWILVAPKKTATPAKPPKDKESKPKEQKNVESKKKNAPKSKEAAPQPKPKVQKVESARTKPSKVEAAVLHLQHAPIAHSMLKRNYHQAVEAPLVKPIRQPIGPPTSGGFGFSSEYRKSRMSAVMAH